MEGRTAPEQRLSADNRVVSPNYYEVMGIPLLRGRAFTEQDTTGQPGVIIINEAMARRTWGDEDPIGKRIIVYLAGREFPVSVVGVVEKINQPRYPSFKGIMAAKKKPLTTLSAADAGLDGSGVGLAAASSVVVEATPAPPRQSGTIVKDEGDGGTKIVAFLVGQKII